MASLIAHAIIGASIARAANLNRRQAALAAAVALLPDADVLVSLAVKGDGEAWHRGPWSHSLATATAAGLAAFLGSLGLEARRNGAPNYGQALRIGFLTWTLLASHLVLDFWLVNPIELGGPPRFSQPHHLPGLIRYQLLNLPTEALLYGSLGFALCSGCDWLRQRAGTELWLAYQGPPEAR